MVANSFLVFYKRAEEEKEEDPFCAASKEFYAAHCHNEVIVVCGGFVARGRHRVSDFTHLTKGPSSITQLTFGYYMFIETFVIPRRGVYEDKLIHSQPTASDLKRPDKELAGMASSTLKKVSSEAMRFVVLGLLLPSVLVSGQAPVTPTGSAAGSTAQGTTASGMTAANTGTMSQMSPSPGSSGANTQPGASTPDPVTSMMTSGLTGTPATMTSSFQTQIMTTQDSIQSATTGVNGTSSSNDTMLNCPSFTCNYSDCNMMYTTANHTACADGYCQLIRQMDMCYTVSCAASCVVTCTNSSQTNCSVNCCNTTNCLSGDFAAMAMTTATMPGASTASMTTSMMTTAPQTTADNGNKCHSATCTGATCYTNFKTVQKCSSTQSHCQLKKEATNAGTKWTAGCTTDCSAQTACKSSTQPPCQLECCTATTSSCLFLNGTLNVYDSSFASRLHGHIEVVTSSLCLLAIGFLL
ncbi:mucin-19 [Synchiropus splendidus]|uniref:mucin-19 n=1 Tax=Synchiropus splendidus TaxID=270530 RepID=UPI00237DA39E|nr:mucin-19 [Synchiropus splendidus]